MDLPAFRSALKKDGVDFKAYREQIRRQMTIARLRASEVDRHIVVTDAEIDKAALYRTLRQLERNGNVKSTWETGEGGPARRVYRLTRAGEAHLEEWTNVLENMSKSMTRFVGDVRRPQQRATGKKKAVSNG